ncbi:hypothetical protein Dform_00619 [Dehalogenimonas formicexedens]|uniref:Uncharacterized protein n=1 Tax=Dehalogenimonas formicexedens TaxID=1839801 RepID=A0A1P8F665_9CHLR|nr:hypothetical protein [Dehalogenimonas formicexedens]APV43974.1 hypothetical protein Dform_00619 [Dehalogenimonas formicexedens]
MTEARVFIDLKEGVIELEGPIEFVEKYIAKYAPGGAAVQTAVEKPAARRGPGRPPKAGKPVRKKKVSCDKIVADLTAAGFFGQERGFGAIKSEMTAIDPGCSDNKIRKALKNAIAAGKLASSGAGRGMKYAEPAAI